jgi:hypothetical protein
MLISHKHKLVIFTLERTASTSIHFVLDKYFDVSIDKSLLHLTLKHVPAETFKALIEPFLFGSYYKVAIFRDPIDRAVSLYTVSNSKETFSKWWKCHREDPWISQKQQLSVNNNLYIDRLFSFNHLDLFSNFISSLENSEIKFPNFGKSDKSNIQLSQVILDSMNIRLQEDNDLYKSIVNAGGELIINPYQPTP